MKTNDRESIFPGIQILKNRLIWLALLAVSALPLKADTVLVLAKTNTATTAINSWPPYLETAGEWYPSTGNPTPNNPRPPAYGTRFGYNNTYPAIQVQPTLTGTGHTYAVYCTLPTSSTILSDTATEISVDSGTLSTNKTLAFGGTQNTWNLVCYLTNNPGAPIFTFTYSTTLIDGVTAQDPASFSRRWYPAPLLFDDVTDKCKETPPVVVNGPLVQGQESVVVTGVSTGATAVNVYANNTNLIGALTAGVVAGANTVPTSALVKGDELKATQVTNNIEGCLPTLGPKVGGGANPEIRVSFILDQDSANAGPIGAPGTLTGNQYHLPATNTVNAGYAYPPVGNIVLQPGPCWQTVSGDNYTDPEVYFTAPTATVILPDPNPYASLAGIAFCVENVDDSGPFDIYIDNIRNGGVLIQDFESATNGEPGFFLRVPSAATIPPAGLIPGLDVSEVTDAYADSGTKSLRYSFQFSNPSDIIWLRALCGGTGTPNPQIDTTKPISMRVLLLPPGGTATDLRAGPIANQVVYPGQTTTFEVTASGTGPFTYQWRLDGVDVPGATTSSYTYTGDYNVLDHAIEVVVGNATCSTLSSAIASVQLPIPTVTNQPVSLIVSAGSPASFTVGADGHVPDGYPLFYQWKHDDVDLLGENAETLNIAAAQLSDAGTYQVTVMNGYGTTNSEIAYLDVVPVGITVGSGTGLRGAYWNASYSTNAFAGEPTLVRLDPTVDFDWGTGGPGDGVGADYFTARWSGQVQALGDDTYTFSTVSDDGVRLWVNGQLVVDNWTLHAATTNSGTITLEGMQKYDVVMDYFEAAGNAVAKLWWSTATGSIPLKPVPTSQLYPAISSPSISFEMSGADLIFTWVDPAGVFVLESATDVAGPYTPVENQTNPYMVTVGAEPQMFFRLSIR